MHANPNLQKETESKLYKYVGAYGKMVEKEGAVEWGKKQNTVIGFQRKLSFCPVF